MIRIFSFLLILFVSLPVFAQNTVSNYSNISGTNFLATNWVVAFSNRFDVPFWQNHPEFDFMMQPLKGKTVDSAKIPFVSDYLFYANHGMRAEWIAKLFPPNMLVFKRYTSGHKKYFIVTGEDQDSFFGAWSRCDRNYGFMLSINSKEENEFVRLKLEVAGVEEIYLGAFVLSNKWTWMDGTKWGYDNFVGENDKTINNKKVIRMRSKDGKWISSSSTKPKCSYIFEHIQYITSMKQTEKENTYFYSSIYNDKKSGRVVYVKPIVGYEKEKGNENH
jgi:hypothetical protein